MFSLDKFPDWSVFTEREVHGSVEVLSPASEVASALQAMSEQVKAAKQTVEDVQDEGLTVLAQQAVYLVRLADVLEHYQPMTDQAPLDTFHRKVRSLKNQMLKALRDAGIEIGVPQGRPYAEVEGSVDIVGWVHREEFTEELVTEVLEPIVRYRSVLIRRGCVVMGAPQRQNPDGASDAKDSDNSRQREEGDI